MPPAGPASTGLALVPKQTALAYVGGALFNPVSLSVMAFAVCVGVGYAGLVGALVATMVFISVGTMATRTPWVRRQLDAQLQYRRRQKREAERMKAVKPAGVVRHQQYADLRDLVNEIERVAPGEAERFELQELLDHYVRLAVGHQKCLESLRLAGTGELRALPDGGSPRRHAILARRMRHRDECIRRIERLADELEAIDELIRLFAQRVACPQVDGELDREIERRLWELDEVDSALDQLSA